MGAKPAKRAGVGVLLSEQDLAEADGAYDEELLVTPTSKHNVCAQIQTETVFSNTSAVLIVPQLSI